MAWSDDAFRDRVTKRCAQVGRSQRAVGVTHDYLQAAPQHGRRIDTIAKLADALEWTLPEIMGLEMFGKADAATMLIAYSAVTKALRVVANPDDEFVAWLLTSAYNLTATRLRRGDKVDEDRLAEDLLEWATNPMPTKRQLPSE